MSHKVNEVCCSVSQFRGMIEELDVKHYALRIDKTRYARNRQDANRVENVWRKKMVNKLQMSCMTLV